MALVLGRGIVAVLTGLGGVWILLQVYKIISFIQTHFLHKSTLGRYQSATFKGHGAAWALVTGATDGIGEAFAEELCERGFNVVIHGRNAQKLENVEKDLRRRWPERKIQTLRIDAGTEPFDGDVFHRELSNLKALNLKVLINNVGGSGGASAFLELEERTSAEIAMLFNVNARFPTEVTRVLLPQLQRNCPAVVINVGSSSSEFCLPYLGVYAGCKSYNRAWSQSLTAEMRAKKRDIEVMFLFVSVVATKNLPRPPSLFVPSAKQLAHSSLNKVGCGKSITFAYWAHELQAAFFSILPASLSGKILVDIGKKEKIEEEKRLKRN